MSFFVLKKFGGATGADTTLAAQASVSVVAAAVLLTDIAFAGSAQLAVHADGALASSITVAGNAIVAVSAIGDLATAIELAAVAGIAAMAQAALFDGQAVILWPSRSHTLHPSRRALELILRRRARILKPARRAFVVMGDPVQFAAKTPTEEPILALNFANQLDQHAPGETIASASWVVTVKSGTDPNPGDMLTGMGAASINGTHVLQKVRGGVDKVRYWHTATATTSQGQKLQLAGELLVDVEAASW